MNNDLQTDENINENDCLLPIQQNEKAKKEEINQGGTNNHYHEEEVKTILTRSSILNIIKIIFYISKIIVSSLTLMYFNKKCNNPLNFWIVCMIIYDSINIFLLISTIKISNNAIINENLIRNASSNPRYINDENYEDDSNNIDRNNNNEQFLDQSRILELNDSDYRVVNIFKQLNELFHFFFFIIS